MMLKTKHLGSSTNYICRKGVDVVVYAVCTWGRGSDRMCTVQEWGRFLHM